jgi:hypothetical protein
MKGLKMNDSDIVNTWALDDFECLFDSLPELPEVLAAKLAAILDPIGSGVDTAEIMQREDSGFALRWEERHPEMVSREEYCEGAYGADYLKLTAEFTELRRALPSKPFELPLTRAQAYAILIVHDFPCFDKESGAFEAENESLLDSLRTW